MKTRDSGPIPYRLVCLLALTSLACGMAGCVSAPPPSEPAQEADAAESSDASPASLSDKGRRYLEDVFLYSCAEEYLPYEDGDGPPVEPRSEREWAERENDLAQCRDDVVEEYVSLDKIRIMTWDGTTHSMKPAEMEGIVQLGPEFLTDYVEAMLQAERRRARTAESESRSGS